MENKEITFTEGKLPDPIWEFNHVEFEKLSWEEGIKVLKQGIEFFQEKLKEMTD